MANPFLDLAERQMPNPVKARIRATEARRSKRGQERQDEQRKLSAYYRAHRKQELDDALAGADRGKLQALIAQLDALTLETIPQLANFVRAEGWHTAAANTARSPSGKRVHHEAAREARPRSIFRSIARRTRERRAGVACCFRGKTRAQ